MDLFFYLLSYWYWFVLAVLICVGYEYYKYATSTFIYSSTATIIIKDPANAKASTRLDAYSNLINKTNVSNEIMQFRSKHLMAEVVSRLDANVNYEMDVKLRRIELYNNTPVKVLFSEELRNVPMSFALRPIDKEKIEVRFGEKRYRVALNDSLKVNGGVLTFVPTSNYLKDDFDKLIYVTQVNTMDAAVGFISRMSIAQRNSDASILTFTMVDRSVNRACDVLNTLFDVYNEEAIKDKNQITVNTAKFIEERIILIGEELGTVEKELQDYNKKQQKNLV